MAYFMFAMHVQCRPMNLTIVATRSEKRYEEDIKEEEVARIHSMQLLRL